jgi:hypothetical protein
MLDIRNALLFQQLALVAVGLFHVPVERALRREEGANRFEGATRGFRVEEVYDGDPE